MRRVRGDPALAPVDAGREADTETGGAATTQHGGRGPELQCGEAETYADSVKYHTAEKQHQVTSPQTKLPSFLTHFLYQEAKC